MILTKKVIENEINKVLGITDARIYKGIGNYCFASKELKTNKWMGVNLNIKTIVDSSLEEFISAVTILFNNQWRYCPTEDPHGIKNSVDVKVTTLKQQLEESKEIEHRNNCDNCGDIYDYTTESCKSCDHRSRDVISHWIPKKKEFYHITVEKEYADKYNIILVGHDLNSNGNSLSSLKHYTRRDGDGEIKIKIVEVEE